MESPTQSDTYALPFSLTHKICSYLMAGSAIAAMIFSDGLTPVAILVLLAGFAASWFAEPPRYRKERYNGAWNGATVVVLVLAVFGAVRTGEVLLAGVYFLCFVLLNKFFNRRTSKDYQQAYVVSLLLLIAATAFSTSLAYALFFVLYLLFATWSLIMLHLRREIESNYLLQHSGGGARSEKVAISRVLNSRRIVTRRFLGATALLSLGMLAAASAVFLLFPRVGFGLFAGPRRHGIALTGFSDRVQLGHHGTIQQNQQVVMRVFFGSRQDPQAAPPVALRWRGSVFDRYREGEWSRGYHRSGRSEVVLPERGIYWLDSPRGRPRLGREQLARRTLQQEIYLEPLEVRVLFGADRPMALSLPERKLGQPHPFRPRRGPLGDVRAAHRRTAGAHYFVYSRVDRPDEATLRASPEVPVSFPAAFLQLPADLSDRIVALAREVTKNEQSAFGKTMALKEHLQRNYQYTLTLSHEGGREPLDEFLFQTRRGHCEYFATAFAIMLRAVGVPTRHVNGFVDGQWNDYGRYLAVRQADAHAWTEVYFQDVGWVAFDATPKRVQTQRATAGLMQTARQLLDALRMRWAAWVLDYDLSKQVAIARKVRSALRRPGPSTSDRQTSTLAPGGRPLLVGVGVMLLGLALAYLTYRVRANRRGGGRGKGHSGGKSLDPAAVIYRKMLGYLERAGLGKPPELTPLEYAATLRSRNGELGVLVEKLTADYYAARYGLGRPRAAAIGRLQPQLTAVRRLLSGAPV